MLPPMDAPARAAGRRPALLGLDLGSSSLKALLVDLEGRPLGERTAPYPTRAPHPGWAEQDPDDWWAAAGAATRALLETADVDVVGVGLAGQMHTFVLLDAAGRVVRPAISWMDVRAHALLPDLAGVVERAGLGPELLNPVRLGLTLPPLVWLRDHEPATLAHARTLLLAKDHLRLRLTGALASEPTDASATLLFDVAGRRWSTATLAAFGLDPRLLPPLGDPAGAAGVVTAEAARHLGLRAGVPVAHGAGDVQAAALGSGSLAPGAVQLVVGTGAQALTVVADPPPPGGVDPRHAFCHLRGWILQASVQNAGVALDWARTLLGLTWSELYAALGDDPPPAAPLFLPYLTGERVPLMKGHARGAWLGLEPGHDRASLARSAVAGVVVAVAAGLAALPVGHGAPVRAAGGGLRHPAFAQALADASGRALEVVEGPSASALGAALLGGVAAGALRDLRAAAALGAAAPAVAFAPRAPRRAAWARLGERHRALDELGFHEAVAAL